MKPTYSSENWLKKNQACILPFPLQTVSQGNWTAEKGKIFFIAVAQLINEEGMIEYHHFVSPGGLMDLDFSR